MSDAPFDFAIRVLSCRTCGAPVRSAIGGGDAECEYCNTRMSIPPRREPAPRAEAGPADGRLASLRAQAESGETSTRFSTDGAPEGAAELARYRAQEPRAGIEELERRFRVALTTAGADEAKAPELFWYAQILNQRLALIDEHLRRRAIVESSLDALDDPGYRHVLCTDLASAAVNLGDLDSAERWVTLCDPAPDDLYLDSTYRVAAARVHQARQEYAEVAELLDDVPVHPRCQLLFTAYRIDVLDRTGRGDEAVRATIDAMRHPVWGKAIMLVLRKNGLAPGVLARLASARRGFRMTMMAIGVAVAGGLAWLIFG